MFSQLPNNGLRPLHRSPSSKNCSSGFVRFLPWEKGALTSLLYPQKKKKVKKLKTNTKGSCRQLRWFSCVSPMVGAPTSQPPWVRLSSNPYLGRLCGYLFLDKVLVFTFQFLKVSLWIGRHSLPLTRPVYWGGGPIKTLNEPF